MTGFRSGKILVLAVVLAALAAAGVAGLLVSIFTHEQEEKRPYFPVVELTDETTDPAIWGRNFPMQYDSYRRTVDQKRTRYGGSEAVPRTPSGAGREPAATSRASSGIEPGSTGSTSRPSAPSRPTTP